MSDNTSPAPAAKAPAPAATIDGTPGHILTQAREAINYFLGNDEASNAPTLNLSAINARLAPLSISGAGLAQFGIEPLATDKNAKLYSEYQLALLCRRITEHIVLVNWQTAAEQMEAA